MHELIELLRRYDAEEEVRMLDSEYGNEEVAAVVSDKKGRPTIE